MNNLINGIRTILRKGSYEEQNEKLKLLLNSPQNFAYSLLAEVLLEIEKLEDWKDVKELKFMAEKIRQEHFS